MEIKGLHPGRPGRGHDPTGGLTDMQWYMYHQKNVAYFAAFATEDYSLDALVGMLRGMFAAAPQFGQGMTLSDDQLMRLITVETMRDFSGMPDRWLDGGFEVFADSALPMVRMRVGRLAGGPDAAGRRSLILVWVAHPFTEGLDSALLSRSHSAAHPQMSAPPTRSGMVTVAARAFAGFAALMHLLVARLWTPHPGRLRVVTRTYPRAVMAAMAKRLGVSQRALYIALTAHVIVGAALPGAKRKSSSTYSTLKAGGGSNRDSFIRMRMLFAQFENREDFAAYARAVEATIGSEGKESGFNAEMNAGAIGFHRWLAGRAPFLYGPKVFQFMPYDFVFALLPPHHLGGPLTRGMVEPVYAGATVGGVNGCVVVPGRHWVTLEFAMEEEMLPNIARLDAMVKALAPEPLPAPLAAAPIASG